MAVSTRQVGRGRAGGEGPAAHLSIIALKSNTPSINLAANLEEIRDQQLQWPLGKEHLPAGLREGRLLHSSLLAEAK